MMAKYDDAPFAAINGNAYRDYLRKHPEQERITLTRGQLEAICRDLIDYTDRDADARGWAEQATKNAAEIHRLRDALGEISEDPAHAVTIALSALSGSVEETALVARGMVIVNRILAEQRATDATDRRGSGRGETPDA